MGDEDWKKSISESLKKLTDNQLKKDDVKAVVNAAIENKVTKRLDKMDKMQDKVEERLTKLEKDKNAGQNVPGCSNSTDDYLHARHSFRLSPCQCSNQAVINFLKRDMLVSL